MATIVITRSKFSPELKERILQLARESKPIFEKQPGFISIEMLINPEGDQTSSILRWKTVADHEACLKSPDWGTWNAEWGTLMQSGKLEFEFGVYEELK